MGGIVHDGTMWEVNIQIDDVKLKSEGQILFPDNFKKFTYELSLLTGGKMFDNEWNKLVKNIICFFLQNKTQILELKVQTLLYLH